MNRSSLVLFPAIAVLFQVVAAASPIYLETILKDSPLGYWRLGESDGVTAADESPNANHGTYGPAGVAKGMRGAILDDSDHSALFSNQGSVSILPRFRNTPGFTLEAWATNENGERYHRLFSNGDPSARIGMAFGIDHHGMMVFTAFGVWDFSSSVPFPRDGRFHHVAVSLDSPTQVRYYFDGVLRETVTTPPRPIINSEREFRLGSNEGDRPEQWVGLIDEAAVYDYVLTDDQIRAHYDAGVLTMYLPGDTDFDGDIDIDDLNAVRNHFGEFGHWGILGDTDRDSDVDLSDLNTIRNNFGASSVPVPEPSSLVLLALGAGMLAILHRRTAASCDL